MKRFISIFLVCLTLTGLLCSQSVSAAAGLSVTASASTVTVGQNVTVTLKYDGDGKTIAGIAGNLTYDTNVFTYVSFTGTDVQVNGGAGKMVFIVTPSGVTAPTSATITLTFKSNAPGSCDFAVATEEFVDDDTYASLGTPSGKVTVTASNPTLSDNANLSRLTPSKGTLTPKFDPDVTEYSVTVPYDVTSVSFSAESEHPDAKISITGKSAVSVGTTKRVLTVTAPNGTTKKYNLTVIRKEAPSTTVGTNPTTGSTTAPVPEDALDVTVDGKKLTILDTQAAVDLPTGFSWSILTVNRVEVPAAVHKESGMTLLYLVSEDKTADGFYIYDETADSFVRFRALTIGGGAYLLYDLPADKELSGMIRGTLEYEGGQVSAYLYRDVALSDFYVVWAAPMAGEAGWYTYDKAEGTLQRHHTATAVGDTVTTPSTTTPDKDVDGQVEKDDQIGSFFEEHKQILLISGIVLAGIVVMVLLFVLLSAGGRKKGKH